MDEMVKVFIGFDAVESVAWHAMAHSILETSTRPVSITPINLKNLRSLFWRERDSRQSNEFSLSRFLVPALCQYEGFGVFFDCDMMMRSDISEIFSVIRDQPAKAVYVVKHDYVPNDTVKYLGATQHIYPRKNWSSVVLWNCGHPANAALTPEYVNSATPLELHRFGWLPDDEIGELDVRWNWLVGEYGSPPHDVKNVHWTVGGPYFDEYADADFSDEWFRLRERMANCLQRTAAE